MLTLCVVSFEKLTIYLIKKFIKSYASYQSLRIENGKMCSWQYSTQRSSTLIAVPPLNFTNKVALRNFKFNASVMPDNGGENVIWVLNVNSTPTSQRPACQESIPNRTFASESVMSLVTGCEFWKISLRVSINASHSKCGDCRPARECFRRLAQRAGCRSAKKKLRCSINKKHSLLLISRWGGSVRTRL